MRILITGSRKWNDIKTISDALKEVASTDRQAALRVEEYVTNGAPISTPPDLSHITVVHGGADGADALAGELAKILGMNVEVHPAQWDIYGRGAGPLRNQAMVDKGADICLGFVMPDSRGTADCLKRAKKAGIPTQIYKGVYEDE
jgi:hypothetical protein